MLSTNLFLRNQKILNTAIVLANNVRNNAIQRNTEYCSRRIALDFKILYFLHFSARRNFFIFGTRALILLIISNVFLL
jgi:hypothetical protein